MDKKPIDPDSLSLRAGGRLGASFAPPPPSPSSDNSTGLKGLYSAGGRLGTSFAAPLRRPSSDNSAVKQVSNKIDRIIAQALRDNSADSGGGAAARTLRDNIADSGGGAAGLSVGPILKSSNSNSFDFSITSILQKQSKSISFMVKGTLNNIKVIGKFYISNIATIDPQNSFGVSYEQQIYKFISQHDSSQYSKHLIGSLHSFDTEITYDELSQFCLTKYPKNLLVKTVTEYYNKYYKKDTLALDITTLKFKGFLLEELEEPKYYKLATFLQLKHYLYANNVIIDIIFEVLYSVYIMRVKLGIMHNDLHFDNIFIEPLILENEFEYKFFEKSFSKIKKYNIIIYDHDHNYQSTLGNNLYLDGILCVRAGECNKMSNNDLYHILTQVYSHKKVIQRYASLDIFNRIISILGPGINESVLKRIEEDKKYNIYCIPSTPENTICPDNYSNFNLQYILESYIDILPNISSPRLQSFKTGSALEVEVAGIHQDTLSKTENPIDSSKDQRLTEKQGVSKKYLKYKNRYLQLKNLL